MCSCTWATCTTTTSPAPAEPVEPVAGFLPARLDRVLSQEHQALFYRRTPLVYVWDDHDYGPTTPTHDSPTRDAARAYYDDRLPALPDAPQPSADGPITQAFDIGRVRFL